MHQDVVAKISDFFDRGMPSGDVSKHLRGLVSAAQEKHLVTMPGHEQDMYVRSLNTVVHGPAGSRFITLDTPPAAPKLPGKAEIQAACASMFPAIRTVSGDAVDVHKAAYAAALNNATGAIVTAEKQFGSKSPEYRAAWAEYQNVKACLDTSGFDAYAKAHNEARQILAEPKAAQDMALRIAHESHVPTELDPERWAKLDPARQAEIGRSVGTLAEGVKDDCRAVVSQYETLGYRPGSIAMNPDTGKPEVLFNGWTGSEHVKLSDRGIAESGLTAPAPRDLDAPLEGVIEPADPARAIGKTAVPTWDMEGHAEKATGGLVKHMGLATPVPSLETSYRLSQTPAVAHGNRAVESVRMDRAKLKAITAVKFLGRGLADVALAGLVTAGMVTKVAFDPKLGENPFEIMEAGLKTPFQFFLHPNVQARYGKIREGQIGKAQAIANARHESGVEYANEYRKDAVTILKDMQHNLPGGYTPQQLNGVEVVSDHLIGKSIGKLDKALRQQGLTPEVIAAMPPREAILKIRAVADQEIAFLQGNGLDLDGSGSMALDRGALLYYGYAAELNTEANLKYRLADVRVRMEAKSLAKGSGSDWGKSAKALEDRVAAIGNVEDPAERAQAYRDLWTEVSAGDGLGVKDRESLTALAANTNSDFLDGYSRQRSMDLIDALVDPEAKPRQDIGLLAAREEVKGSMNVACLGSFNRGLGTVAANSDLRKAFAAKRDYEHKLAVSYSNLVTHAPSHAAELMDSGLDPANLIGMVDSGETIGGNATLRGVGATKMLVAAGSLEAPKDWKDTDPIGYAKVGANLEVASMIGYKQPQGLLAEEAKLHFYMPSKDNPQHDFRITVTLSGDDLQTKSVGDLRRQVLEKFKGTDRTLINDDALLRVLKEAKGARTVGGLQALTKSPGAALKFPTPGECVKPSIQNALSKDFDEAMARVGQRLSTAYTNQASILNPFKAGQVRRDAIKSLIKDHSRGELYGGTFSRNFQNGGLGGMAKAHHDFMAEMGETVEEGAPA
jgi:hypothetical protein